MVARSWSSSRISCGEHLLLRCEGNAGNSFPTTQGKDPTSPARRRKRGSSECGQNSRASSRFETGMPGNFLSCSKGVKDPLEVPDVRCDKSRDASVEMVLISPGGENLLDFAELRKVLSTYDGDLRDPLWGPQERPVPMGVARGFLGIPLLSMPGPKTLCGVGAEPEDSSPVLTWILGYFWSLPRGVSPHLVWGHARALLSRAVAAVSHFLSRGSRDLWFSLEAFQRGFPTGLSHVSLWCESILGLKVEAVQGK